MLKKEEVYVRVSSKNKARKLCVLLEMFGENVYIETLERLKNGIVSDDYPYICIDDENEWCGFYGVDETKTKVSLKELRNVLAREYLKEGDVVVCQCGKDEVAVGVFKEYTDEFGFDLDNCVYLDGKYKDFKGTGGCFDDFIRYATEEEKKLLKPDESVIEGAISLLRHGLGLDYTSPVIQGLEKLKNK